MSSTSKWIIAAVAIAFVAFAIGSFTAFDAAYDEDSYTTEFTSDNATIDTEKIIKSGETFTLEDTITFTQNGKLVFKSGSTLAFDTEFTVKSMGSLHDIIIVEEGAIIALSSFTYEVDEKRTIGLKGELDYSAQYSFEPIALLMVADIGLNDVFSLDGVEVTGGSDPEFYVAANVNTETGAITGAVALQTPKLVSGETTIEDVKMAAAVTVSGSAETAIAVGIGAGAQFTTEGKEAYAIIDLNLSVTKDRFDITDGRIAMVYGDKSEGAGFSFTDIKGTVTFTGEAEKRGTFKADITANVKAGVGGETPREFSGSIAIKQSTTYFLEFDKEKYTGRMGFENSTLEIAYTDDDSGDKIVYSDTEGKVILSLTNTEEKGHTHYSVKMESSAKATITLNGMQVTSFKYGFTAELKACDSLEINDVSLTYTQSMTDIKALILECKEVSFTAKVGFSGNDVNVNSTFKIAGLSASYGDIASASLGSFTVEANATYNPAKDKISASASISVSGLEAKATGYFDVTVETFSIGLGASVDYSSGTPVCTITANVEFHGKAAILDGSVYNADVSIKNLTMTFSEPTDITGSVETLKIKIGNLYDISTDGKVLISFKDGMATAKGKMTYIEGMKNVTDDYVKVTLEGTVNFDTVKDIFYIEDSKYSYYGMPLGCNATVMEGTGSFTLNTKVDPTFITVTSGNLTCKMDGNAEAKLADSNFFLNIGNGVTVNFDKFVVNKLAIDAGAKASGTVVAGLLGGTLFYENGDNLLEANESFDAYIVIDINKKEAQIHTYNGHVITKNDGTYYDYTVSTGDETVAYLKINQTTTVKKVGINTEEKSYNITIDGTFWKSVKYGETFTLPSKSDKGFIGYVSEGGTFFYAGESYPKLASDLKLTTVITKNIIEAKDITGDSIKINGQNALFTAEAYAKIKGKTLFLVEMDGMNFILGNAKENNADTLALGYFKTKVNNVYGFNLSGYKYEIINNSGADIGISIPYSGDTSKVAIAELNFMEGLKDLSSVVYKDGRLVINLDLNTETIILHGINTDDGGKSNNNTLLYAGIAIVIIIIIIAAAVVLMKKKNQ